MGGRRRPKNPLGIGNLMLEIQFGIVDWVMLSGHSGRIWRYDPDSPSQMSKVLLGTVNHPQKVDSRARKPISQTRPNHDFELKISCLSGQDHHWLGGLPGVHARNIPARGSPKSVGRATLKQILPTRRGFWDILAQTASVTYIYIYSCNIQFSEHSDWAVHRKAPAARKVDF